jgi:hypothetical protein
MSSSSLSRTTRSTTPDPHDFPTRSYDLVKEFVIALAAISVLTAILAVVFSSPDDKAITLQKWAEVAPNNVLETATAELAGTSTSASYGAPYNHNSEGQAIGPVSLQRSAGVTIPLDSAKELVLDPLRTSTNDQIITALATWDAGSDTQRKTWASAYADALTTAGDAGASAVPSGDYGPVPALAQGELDIAASGALEGLLTTRSTFYGSDNTKPLLLLADGSYLEDRARAENLGGDQWGMMNETGNYPGQPWLWAYTFWYQVKPLSTSGNADALVWGLMAVLSAALILLPWIPGLRRLPHHLGIHHLIWKSQRPND